MIDKGFNLFDECAARCVHLSPQEEECTSSSGGDSKIYKSGSSVKWGLLVRNEVGLFQIFNFVKTIKNH